ncbi:hypothetical protein PLESTB_000891900 [Pleodorina starrii]|uniref:Uncharacterized protein n=1 Tax=Pleodorina starrii TaxID=330485 RepID=A0A9W6BM71_9CHLO|nr:hypothetical protein PLESTB_000891900 [Pleodorina starrii]
MVLELTPKQLEWLANKPYMEDCTTLVDPRYRETWQDLLAQEDKYKEVIDDWKRLAFPSFRRDLHHDWNTLIDNAAPSPDRDQARKRILEEGLFPPKINRLKKPSAVRLCLQKWLSVPSPAPAEGVV